MTGELISPTVYPRVCGGTAQRALKVAPQNGLSPRVRGNLTGKTGRRQVPGSIPACAGEPHWHSPGRVC